MPLFVDLDELPRGGEETAMRFLMIVKAASNEATATATDDADATLSAALATYRAALARAGVLLDASVLQPSANGWRLRAPRGGERASALEAADADASGSRIVATLLVDVRSRDEALEWTRRFPVPSTDDCAEVDGGAGAGRRAGGTAGADLEIEVRPLVEPDAAAAPNPDTRARLGDARAT